MPNSLASSWTLIAGIASPSCVRAVRGTNQLVEVSSQPGVVVVLQSHLERGVEAPPLAGHFEALRFGAQVGTSSVRLPGRVDDDVAVGGPDDANEPSLLVGTPAGYTG